MINSTLFGLALAPLYTAIATVESDKGATSDNVYQIREIYVIDANRTVEKWASAFNGRPGIVFSADDVKNRKKSELMMLYYWDTWGRHYEKKTGNPVTYEVIARIHNGGPLGWKKPVTLQYWERVRRVMQQQTQADVNAWAKGGVK